MDPATLTDFVMKVKNATTDNSRDVVQSQATVSTIVGILNNVADVSKNFTLDEVVLTVSSNLLLLYFVTCMTVLLQFYLGHTPN